LEEVENHFLEIVHRKDDIATEAGYSGYSGSNPALTYFRFRKLFPRIFSGDLLMRYSVLHRNLTLLGFLLSACAPGPTPATPTEIPSPARAMIAPRVVSFTTPDGATLNGTLYGLGKSAVIFSVMGNCKRGWEEMADLVSRQDMMALTYQWRGCRETGVADNNEMKKFVDDLRGAINFMRAQGADKIILAGASLGGCASAKLLVESHANGLIVIASPPEIPQWNFQIEATDVNADIPKLFIAAENDDTVPMSDTRALYDLAAEPKEWQTYPGTAHGTDLFETQSVKELQQRLLTFILEIAAKP
jgi:esterase/lipase